MIHLRKTKTITTPIHRGQWYEIWHQLCKNKVAMVCLCYICLMVLVAIFADVITPYSYSEQDLSSAFQGPSLAHLMGTDNYGRDTFTRIIYGARTSLVVSAIACAFSVVIALILGSLVGFYGGRFDNIVMRILDVFNAIPGLLLAISISTAFGSGIFNTAIAISIGGIPALTRQLRASVLLAKDQEYIDAAKAFGASDAQIIWKHIIPNTLAPLIVQITMRLGDSILVISSLSFIGLGVQPPTPEWGNMLATAREYIRQSWSMLFFPGLAIGLSMLSFNLLGDGLRDAMDPRLRDR
ncbi:MAG: ABC transporter permease [Oscillospiraceae bacterium]|nr:ABC transporter permease [Oscillospiraceae bacterium]